MLNENPVSWRPASRYQNIFFIKRHIIKHCNWWYAFMDNIFLWNRWKPLPKCNYKQTFIYGKMEKIIENDELLIFEICLADQVRVFATGFIYSNFEPRPSIIFLVLDFYFFFWSSFISLLILRLRITFSRTSLFLLRTLWL